MSEYLSTDNMRIKQDCYMYVRAAKKKNNNNNITKSIKNIKNSENGRFM